MAIASVGYAGDVGEAEWASIQAHTGSPYSYLTPDALRCYPGTGTREVMITDGVTVGHGVRVSVSGERFPSLPAPSSGSVTYMMCLKRKWGAGARVSTLTALGMSGSSPVGRATTPGAEDDQPLCLATVTAGSSSITNLVDLRVHASKAHFAPSLQAATYVMQPGGRYVLANGDRYVCTVSSGGLPGLEKEKDPPPPVIPTVPIVRAGTAGLTFDSSGQATLNHGLGWTPQVFIPSGRMDPATVQVDVAVSYAAGALTSQYATLVAKIQSPDPPGWKAYQGSLSYVDWVAYGGVVA